MTINTARRRLAGWALVAAGALVWIIAATVDRIVNGGEILGVVVFIVGVTVLASADQ